MILVSFHSSYKHLVALIILNGILICFSANSYSQQIIPDTIHDEDEFFDLPEDTTQESTEYVPEDFIFIPSDVLYNNSWDNTNVRQKKTDLSTMEDSTLIMLSHPSENPFVFPSKGKFLSPFGYRGRHFHAGVDIKLNGGDPVYCAFDGKVRLAKRYRGYGNIVVVRHFNGLETVYSHLSKLLVKVNDDIKAGDVLGLGGHTGRATTNHLHFETRFLGEPFNPQVILDLDSFRLKSDTLLVTPELFKYSGKKKISAGTGKSNGHSKNGSSHTVRKGDTLSEIATQHNTTISKICKLNRISKNTKLKIGRRLRVR